MEEDSLKKTVAVIGTGRMSEPIVDYLVGTCGCRVFAADQRLENVSRVAKGRSPVHMFVLPVEDGDKLDTVIRDSDIVISMVPRPLHIHVARSCLRNRKHLLTTSYEPPEIVKLGRRFKEKGLLVINELGEDPGLDHLGTQLLIDRIRREGGKIKELNSYGCGLPSFRHNNNPFGYKFSWDPAGLFAAAQTPAAYYQNGKRLEIAGERLFFHFRLVDIPGLGTFETYPNRDCRKYITHFGLDDTVSFYRGLLRYPGYCNTMRYLQELGLFRQAPAMDLVGKGLRDFTSSLVKRKPGEGLEESVARFLNLDVNADFIHRFKWLGFFGERPVGISRGTPLDVLMSQMTSRLVYEPGEQDMVVIHVDIRADFPDGGRQRRIATLVKEGDPEGFSAMSMAVGYTVAVTARLVLQGKISGAGIFIPPTLPHLCLPVTAELSRLGFEFSSRIVEADIS